MSLRVLSQRHFLDLLENAVHATRFIIFFCCGFASLSLDGRRLKLEPMEEDLVAIGNRWLLLGRLSRCTAHLMKVFSCIFKLVLQVYQLLLCLLLQSVRLTDQLDCVLTIIRLVVEYVLLT